MGKHEILRLSAHPQNPLAHPRQIIEDEIERLIGLLDALDGDTDHEDVDEDFEPDADGEPWLAVMSGWTDYGDDREIDEVPA